MNKLWARRDDEQGAVLIMAAAGIVVAMIAAALAIDLGMLAQTARQNQKVADLASLDGVRSLPGNPQGAAEASAQTNGFNLSTGTVLAEPLIVALGVAVPSPPGLANAVRVTVTSQSKNAIVQGSQTVTRKATATLGNGAGCTLPDLCVRVDNSPLGSVRVGSTLASVETEDATFLNRFMNSVAGGSASLDAVGWQGIADGQVTLAQLRNSLANQVIGQPAEAKFRTGTVDEVLATNVTYTQLLSATAAALDQNGHSEANTAVASLAATVTGTGSVNLGKVFSAFGSLGSGKDVASANINALDIVKGGVVAADGDHFVSMNYGVTSIPGLPGASATVKVGFIEAPQEAHGPPKIGSTYRTVAKTSQVRVQVTLNLPVTLPTFGNVSLTVPYYFEAGSAEAKLDTMTCPSGATNPSKVTIVAQTKAASMSLAAVADSDLTVAAVPTLTAPTLVDINLLLATLKIKTNNVVETEVVGAGPSTLEFTSFSDTTSQHIGNSSNVAISSVAGTDLVVTASTVPPILNLELNIGSAVTTALNTAGSALTNAIVTPLFKGLGVSYAGADIWAPPPQLCHPTSYNVDPPPSTPVQIPSLLS